MTFNIERKKLVAGKIVRFFYPFCDKLFLYEFIFLYFIVVGRIGSGKSSLLSSILGEMHKFNGNMNIYGKIAYASQVAWIQNATIRENILFGDNLKSPVIIA